MPSCRMDPENMEWIWTTNGNADPYLVKLRVRHITWSILISKGLQIVGVLIQEVDYSSGMIRDDCTKRPEILFSDQSVTYSWWRDDCFDDEQEPSQLLGSQVTKWAWYSSSLWLAMHKYLVVGNSLLRLDDGNRGYNSDRWSSDGYLSNKQKMITRRANRQVATREWAKRHCEKDWKQNKRRSALER